jgi:hypothetical protein
VSAGQQPELFYRHWYRPDHGMFCALPDDLGLGSFQADPAPPTELAALPDNKGFIKEGVEYKVGADSAQPPG